MMAYLGAFFGSVFLSNIMLYSLDGLPAISDDKFKLKEIVIGGVSKLVIGLLSILIIYPINHYLLQPVEYGFLLPILVVLVSLNLTFLVNRIIEKTEKFEPTQTTNYQFIFLNSIVITASLLVANNANFGIAIAQVLGFLAGHFMLVFVIYTMKARLTTPGVPKAFKGLPLMVITLGLIAMIFLGLAGIL